MLSFEEAHGLVVRAKRPCFDGPGEFYVATWGFETTGHFIIPNGAREAVLGNDGRFDSSEGRSTIIEKVTGVIEEWPSDTLLP